MDQDQKYPYVSLPLQGDDHEFHYRPKQKNWKIGTVVLLLLNVFLVGWIVADKWQPKNKQYSILANTPLHPVEYQHFSAYSSGTDDRAQVDAMWEQIKVEHGIVNIDRKWAEKHNLPPTREAYTDPTKNNYVIDAYHHLHCLISLRKGFFNFYNNMTNPLDRHVSHYDHCFDTIRQVLMCSAVDELLPVWGDNLLGDGVVRQCKNWAALRDWATAHSACDPNDQNPGHELFCTNGTDGLLDTII